MHDFFQLYHKYVKLTEPPPNYHFWCGISAISALLGKKCFIPQGKFTTFPNLYVVLVGAPAMRKSTALSTAKNLVRATGKVPVAPESATRESLLDDMAASKVEFSLYGKDISYWQSSAFVGELEQFIGGKHVNDSMVKFMTAIWDEPFFKERTRKGGEVIIHNPYFTMLAACTSSWMNQKLQGDVISDGFTRRTIFVLETELNCKNSWPEDTEEEEQAKKLLAAESIRIFNLAGKFELTKEARVIWDKLYSEQDAWAEEHSPRLRPYFSSRHILLQKVAMCVSAATRSDRLIDSNCLMLSHNALLGTEKNLDKVFAGVGRNVLNPLCVDLIDYVQAHGETTLTKLLELYCKDLERKEFEEVIQTAVDLGGIKAVQYSSGSSEHHVAFEPVNKKKPGSSVNLLALACQLRVSSEKRNEGIASSGVLPALARETEQLLSNQQQKKSDLRQGILLRGKSPVPPQTQVPL